MSFPRELTLNENRIVQIIYSQGESNFGGELLISPQKIILTIIADVSDNRTLSLGATTIEQLTCKGEENSFFLYDLNLINSSSLILSSATNKVRQLKYTYIVDWIIHIPFVTANLTYSGLSIHSPTIDRWIDQTTTQRELAELYQKNGNTFGKNIEFELEVGSLGTITAWYQVYYFESYSNFQVGMNFKPTININLKGNILAKEIKMLFDKLYYMFSFFSGQELLVTQVQVFFEDSAGSLYIARGDQNPEICPIFLPLGKNKFFGKSHPLPLSSIENYINLNNDDLNLFKKYFTYRRHLNIEESFLGYFRLLETICFQKKTYFNDEIFSSLALTISKFFEEKEVAPKTSKNFLKRLAKINESKLNTQGCIELFYDRVPSTITNQLFVKKEDIKKICDLRNDMSHANPFTVDEETMWKFCKFIEALLIIALCEKIQIPFAIIESRVRSINRSDMLVSQEAITVVSMNQAF